MRLLMLVSAAICTSVVLGADVKEPGELPAYELPKDPKAAVLTLDFTGGVGPPRQNDEPTLVIRADGTAIVGNPWGQQKRMEVKLEKAQVQALLWFALEKNKFFDLDAAKLKGEVMEAQQKKGGLGFAIADAATTTIRIHANGKEHEVQYYALGMAANQWPQVKGLASLHAIEKKLNQVRSEIYAGGPAGVAERLKLANAELKAKHPDAAPLTANDLQTAWQLANGQTTVAFMRQSEADGKITTINAQVAEAEKGPAKVTVNVNVRETPQK